MEFVAFDQRPGILHLPAEVLETVFANSVLSVRDLCSLRRTCSLFREVIESNSLWKIKFCERWPRLFLEIGRRNPAIENAGNLSWKCITRQRILVKQTVNRRLGDMAQDRCKNLIKYLLASDERQFYNFLQLLPPEIDTNLQSTFIVDELQRILSRSHEWVDLTRKYYAEKSLWCFHHQLLQPEIEKFMATSLDEQDVEVGATLIAQWFQPTNAFTVEDIKQEFDSLANLTKQALKIINPDHPVLSDEPIIPMKGKSAWKPEKCRQIIQAIEMVIKPPFNKRFDSYYTPTNSYINIVLSKKEGIPITLCLIVMCVARRLRLDLEPVNFPSHFILRWLEFPSKVGIDKYSFIDVFGGKYFLSFQNLLDESFSTLNFPIVEAHCSSCTYTDVLHCILRNLLNIAGHPHAGSSLNLLHCVELLNLFIPHDVELAILPAQVALDLKVNIPRALSRIQEAPGEYNVHTGVLVDLQIQCQELLLLLQRNKDEEITSKQVKQRSDNVKVMFAVGMVMKHKKYNYLCVITGWDEMCQASEQWIKQMKVDKCERGRMQPFYNVWIMDSSNRYAAEENLVFTKETVVIKHPEVGQFFESFTGRYYVPGPELAAEYPDDLQITHNLVTKFFEEQQ